MLKDDFNILLLVFSDLSLMNMGYVEQKINFWHHSCNCPRPCITWNDLA